MRLGTLALVGRNAAQLQFCFLGSALLNVVSQGFFAAKAPGSRDAWLSATLLLGTIAGTLGISAAKRWGFGQRPLVAGLGVAIGGAVLFGGAERAATPLAFAVISVVLRFVLQYGTQELDRRAVTLAGAEGRRENDLVGLSSRFGGMLLGPLWFGLVRDASAATAMVVALVAALGAWNAWLVAGAAPTAVVEQAPSGLAPSFGDSALLAGARVIYAAYYLLASSIIYVLSELDRVQAATRKGGLLVTLVYGAAITATVVEMARRRTGRRSALGMLPAAALMVLVGVALPAPVTAHPLVLVAGGVALGLAFARFQLAFRDHATHAAVHRGRPALLAAYNDLANTSALLGYAAMATLVAARRALAMPHTQAVGLGIAVLGALAVPLVVAGARASREHERDAAAR